MSKILTLDEMLDCLTTLDPPTAQRFKIILETTGSAMADIIGAELGVSTGPATFESLDLAGTCAPFRPAYPGQPCPAPLAPYDPDEWTTEETVVPLQKFTIETVFTKPFYRLRVYEAATLEDACRQALEDKDYENEQANENAAGIPYVAGIWPGEDAAYKSKSLPIPSIFRENPKDLIGR